MHGNLDHCLDLVGLAEGGYCDHPDDPGGPTCHGITQRTLSAARGRPVSKADVQALTVEEARRILAAQYANPVAFDELPAGLDYAVFDACVNSGPDRAAKLLQQALGMPRNEIDGVIGLHTLDVLRKVNDRDGLIITYNTARLAFMRSLRIWRTFGRGWEARVKAVQYEALMLADGVVIPAAESPVPLLSEFARAKATGPTRLLALPSGKAAVAAAVTIAGAASAAATQATGLLSPYSDIQYVRYALVGLALVASVSSVVVQLGRARAGATT